MHGFAGQVSNLALDSMYQKTSGTYEKGMIASSRSKKRY